GRRDCERGELELPRPLGHRITTMLEQRTGPPPRVVPCRLALFGAVRCRPVREQDVSERPGLSDTLKEHLDLGPHEELCCLVRLRGAVASRCSQQPRNI